MNPAMSEHAHSERKSQAFSSWIVYMYRENQNYSAIF